MKITRRIALLGLAAALALVLSYVESLVPLSVGVPGVRIGFANIAVIFALYRLSVRDAAIISGVRILGVALLFGNWMATAYSVAGAVLSLLGMALLRRFTKLAVPTVSAVGGVLHNAGQIAVAVCVTSTAQIAWYFSVLVLTGTVAGIVIGLVGALLVSRVKF